MSVHGSHEHFGALPRSQPASRNLQADAPCCSLSHEPGGLQVESDVRPGPAGTRRGERGKGMCVHGKSVPLQVSPFVVPAVIVLAAACLSGMTVPRVPDQLIGVMDDIDPRTYPKLLLDIADLKAMDRASVAMDQQEDDEDA